MIDSVSLRWKRWIVPATIVLVVWSLTTHGKPSVSGDEPHYLIIDESLVADRDLDVENNYRADDSAKFGHDATDPELHARRTRSGALWSVHDIGLPILLLPVYAAATRLAPMVSVDLLARFRMTPGLFAYSLITLALTILTAFGGSLVFGGLRRVTTTGRAAAIALAVVLSPPVLAHAFLVFPEGPAFVITCAVVCVICLDEMELTMARMSMAMLALAVMPWLHRRYALFSVGLAFIVWHRHAQWFKTLPRRRLAVLAALLIVPHAAMHAWTLWAWGNLGGPQLLTESRFSLAGFWTGAIGLLLDREYGLLAFAPIYWIAPIAFAINWRRDWDLVVPILLLYLPMACFDDWHGGYAPAARYLVALAPLVALVVARPLAQPIVRRLAMALLVFQVLVDARVWQHPRWLWPNGSGTNRALEGVPLVGPAYEHSLPRIGRQR